MCDESNQGHNLTEKIAYISAAKHDYLAYMTGVS
jgi:hypothetical protein